MSQPTPRQYRIERIADEGGLARLAEPWRDLAADIPELPVFLTWEWISSWCRHMERGWQSWLLAAWDDRDCLAGVAPFMLSRHRYGPLRVDRLSFMGSNYAYRQHQDLVARPVEKAAVFAAMLDYLQARPGAWDVLDLEGVAEASPLRELLKHARGRYGEKAPEMCPYVSLPASWEAYELQKLSANRRQQLRARLRRLERAYPGQVTLGRAGNTAELNQAMDALIRLHRKRWHQRGQGSSFDIPSFLEFHRDLAAVSLARGWLRLYYLQVGQEIIAVEYCYFHNGVLFDYQKAFDPDWDQYSPGQICLGYAIRQTIAEGGHELDMARGTYDYKFSWTDQERVDYHVALSRSLAGHIWLLGGNFVAGARDRARSIVPESLRERINHLLSPNRRQAAVGTPDGN